MVTNYTVAGVSFTLTENDDGDVVNLKSDNDYVVVLIGQDGITFGTPIGTNTAEAIADGIATLLA